MKLRAEQRVSRHDADDRERDRRHDDERHRIGAELRHDEQVNEHQAHRIGEAHVAESLVGDRPLAVPLDAEVAQAIGRTDETLRQRLAGGRRLVDLRDQAEHAVQRTVEPAGHVAGDEHHRQQILVVDRRVPRLLGDT